MESLFTKDEIQAKLEGKYWYHSIDLPHGIVTPGKRPCGDWHRDLYRIPESLDGLRVLDVGAWDGYWTFEALRRGAKEVVAIDDFSDLLAGLTKENRGGWDNFDTVKEILAYSDDQCQRHDICLYDLTEDHFGRFDVIFCFGVLYHLRYPLRGLDVLSAVCDQAMYMESAVCDFQKRFEKDWIQRQTDRKWPKTQDIHVSTGTLSDKCSNAAKPTPVFLSEPSDER